MQFKNVDTAPFNEGTRGALRSRNEAISIFDRTRTTHEHEHEEIRQGAHHQLRQADEKNQDGAKQPRCGLANFLGRQRVRSRRRGPNGLH